MTGSQCHHLSSQYETNWEDLWEQCYLQISATYCPSWEYPVAESTPLLLPSTQLRLWGWCTCLVLPAPECVLWLSLTKVEMDSQVSTHCSFAALG